MDSVGELQELQVSRAVIAELQKEMKQLKVALELESEKGRRALEQETERCIVILELKERLENIACDDGATQEEVTC